MPILLSSCNPQKIIPQRSAFTAKLQPTAQRLRGGFLSAPKQRSSGRKVPAICATGIFPAKNTRELGGHLPLDPQTKLSNHQRRVVQHSAGEPQIGRASCRERG